MYVSIQTVCGCHGYLLFDSIYCDRCRSLIPFQVTDESLIDPASTKNMMNGIDLKTIQDNKNATNMLMSYRKQLQQQQGATTGRVRFRALCPFCNSPTYVLRYYCKRERLYYHLRVQNFGENEQNFYKSIAEVQNMHNTGQYITKSRQTESSETETTDDSYSLSGSTSRQPPSTISYNDGHLPNARDEQIENEKNLYALNDLEGDLFSVLRNGLFFDTIIQCQDDVTIQVHRCILGARSSWFRQLLSEYHDTNAQDDYVLKISVDDVESNVMNEVLNFMYTNRCLISLKNAPLLLIAAKRFELERLRKQIAEFLLTRLTVDNAIEMLICAHEAGSEALKSASIRVINRHAEKIKRTEKWKTFKTQYIDLVPELYENRVEHPTPAPPTFFSEVFSAPAKPSESLLTLSKLYENPVKQRFASPTPRILPPPIKPQNLPPPHTLQIGQQTRTNDPVTQGTSGHFGRHNDLAPSPAGDRESPTKNRESPGKKRSTSNNTRRRPGPPLTRTIFPSVKQPAEADAYRRPVNVYEKSTALSTNNQKQQTVNTEVPQKPPPPPSTKVSRAVSPNEVLEIHRSPTLTDMPSEEHMTSARIDSSKTME